MSQLELFRKNKIKLGPMQDTEAALDSEACFKLKGSRVTMTILELYRYDYKSFNDTLSSTVSSAPDFRHWRPSIQRQDQRPHDHGRVGHSWRGDPDRGDPLARRRIAAEQFVVDGR